MKNHRSTLSAAALAAALTLSAQAQVTETLPRPGASGHDSAYLTLFDQPSTRLQLLLDRSHLASFLGTSLTGITLRNHPAAHMPVEKGSVRLILRLSTAARKPASPATRFDLNQGQNKVTLFDQVVDFKDIPPYQGSLPLPWSDQRNLAITFNGKYPYTGGDLCLEIESRAVTGKELPTWTCDGVVPGNMPPGGTPFGQASPGVLSSFTPMLFGMPGPGETVPLLLTGVVPGTPAILLLGVSRSSLGPLPLPLGLPGAGGHTLWLNVTPDVIIPLLSQPAPPVQG